MKNIINVNPVFVNPDTTIEFMVLALNYFFK